MNNPEEVAALQRRVEELGRLLETASRGLFAGVKEERRLTIRLVRLLVEAIISLGTQLNTLQLALIHSAAVSDEQLNRARADLKADLSVEIALNPEWSAQVEKLLRLEAELDADLALEEKEDEQA
jgi:hypothetical protein